MQRLIEGLHHFQSQVFGNQRELFERLAKGQAPETLFITCADSRIDPCLLTQSAPGDLFILRNAGNLVPPYGAVRGGEAATIEFAIAGLGVKDIIVCGHSHCGAMKGLLDPPPATAFPALNDWLSHAEATRRIMHEKYADRNRVRTAQRRHPGECARAARKLAHASSRRLCARARQAEAAWLGLQDRDRRSLCLRPRDAPIRTRADAVGHACARTERTRQRRGLTSRFSLKSAES